MPQPRLRFPNHPPDRPLSQAKGRNGWIYIEPSGIQARSYRAWQFDQNLPSGLSTADCICIEPASYTGRTPSWELWLTRADAEALLAQLTEALKA